jgi:hypothetical protein
MEKTIILPDFQVELQFKDRDIICFDLITKSILDFKKLPYNIKQVRQEEEKPFIIQIDDSANCTYRLEVKFMTEVDNLETNAEYIRNICFDSPDHGYYFGTYEIGEFSVTQDHTLQLIRSYSIQYCLRGLLTPNQTIFLSLHENEMSEGPSSEFLVKLQWPENSSPVILWKKSVSSAIRAMRLIEDFLFLGFQDGSIQRWNRKTDKYVDSLSLFDAPVNEIIQGNNAIFVSSKNGDVASIGEDGSVFWKMKPSVHSIPSLLENEGKIHFFDQTGKYFFLDPETGHITQTMDNKINPSVHSNLVAMRGWFLFNDGFGIQAIQMDGEERRFQIIPDLYIRYFHSFSNRFLTGDDGGFIRLWLFGQLEFL